MSIESAKRIHQEVIVRTALNSKNAPDGLTVAELAKWQEEQRQLQLAAIPEVVTTEVKVLRGSKRPVRRNKIRIVKDS